ncbi:hypothetical protein WA026_006581, partial [Henosepilachna vigintioctopunctata]
LDLSRYLCDVTMKRLILFNDELSILYEDYRKPIKLSVYPVISLGKRSDDQFRIAGWMTRDLNSVNATVLCYSHSCLSNVAVYVKPSLGQSP